METKKATTIDGAAAGQIETEQNVSKVILTQTSSFLQDEILKILQENIEKAHETALNTPQAMEHFHKRGLTDETIRRFKLGYCENGVKGLFNRGHDEHKYIFPILDEKGEPESVIGEIFDREKMERAGRKDKYYKPPTTLAPAHYFNEWYLRAETPPEIIYLCEGVYDAISIEQVGHAAIALMGTGRARFFDLIDEYKPNLKFILYLDGDEPGQRTAEAIKQGLSGRGTFYYEIPQKIKRYKDANDYLQAEPQKLKELCDFATMQAGMEAAKAQMKAEAAKYYADERAKEEKRAEAIAKVKLEHLNDYTRERILQALNGNYSAYSVDQVNYHTKKKKKKTEPRNILDSQKTATDEEILTLVFACLLWLGLDESDCLDFVAGSVLENRTIVIFGNEAVNGALEEAMGLVGGERQDLESILEKYDLPTDKDYSKLINYDNGYQLNYPGYAERYFYLYDQELIYIIEDKKFYLWSGNCWREAGNNANDEVLPLCLTTLRFCDELTDTLFPPARICTLWEMSRKTELHQAFQTAQNSKRKIIDEGLKAFGDMHHHIEELDSDNWTLNTANKTIDLETGATYTPKQEDYMTKNTRAEFQPHNESDLWAKTLENVLPDPDTRRYIQKFFGYCLTGSIREHKLLFCYGEGGCGKSTVIEAITHTLGNYAKTIPIDSLMCSRNDGDGERAKPVIASLKGVRLAIAGESRIGARLNDAMIKSLTGGDVINARKLYGDSFNFEPTHKIVLTSNFLPSLQDGSDEALKQRFAIIPFRHKFRNTAGDDKALSEKLRTPENMASILNWMLDGLKLWLDEGLGDLPPEIKEATEAYFEQADELQNFINEYYEIDPRGKVRVGAMRDFFNTETNRKMGRAEFSLLMERHGYKKIMNSSKRFYFEGLKRRED